MHGWLEYAARQIAARPCAKISSTSFSGPVAKGCLEEAVRREHCNWDMPLRQGHVFEILLPEVTHLRDMARIIELRAPAANRRGEIC